MKSVEEIYDSLRAEFTARTGLDGGADGDLAVRLYAVAAQLQALYVQADWVERQCFPQTAQGDYLDRHAALRGLSRRTAAPAEGVIRFSKAAEAAEVSVAEGTVCMTADLKRFITTQAAVLRAGETSADVPAQAEQAGTAGNVAAGSILTMTVAPVGVSGCTNPAPFTGGAEAEGDEALRKRILETFQRLPNGANEAFYQQGALAYPDVAAAVVLPRKRGRGTVDVVVTGPGGTPGEELLAGLTEWFDQRREIAVDVLVREPETETVDVTVQIQPAEGKSYAQAAERVEQAVSGWFCGKRLGKNVLRAELGALVFALPEVANCAVTTPTEDVTVGEDMLPVLGTLTIEEME